MFDLLPREFSKFRFFCAGRLDLDSEGLVILTTDGDLANRLMHPSNVVVKRYHVILKQPFPAGRLAQLVRGVVVEGEGSRSSGPRSSTRTAARPRPTSTSTCTTGKSAKSARSSPPSATM